MTFDQILSEVKQGTTKPVYFLMGEEAYFIDKLADAFANLVVEESARDFDQTVVFGNDTNVANITAMAKEFPLMGGKKLVLVKEAQNIRNIEHLEGYAKQPQPSTVLVICYKFKKLDKRKAAYKTINKTGVIFSSDKVKDYKLQEWISAEVSKRGFRISPKTSAVMSEYIGNDLPLIMSALEKLEIHVPKGNEITAADIEKYVGISKTYNIFELQKAIGKRDLQQTFKIVQHFANNEKDHPFVLTISGLYNYFSKIMALHYLPNKSESSVASALKINPYFAKEYIQTAKIYNARKTIQVINLLREYDLKSKGFNNTSTSQGELLKELIFQITN